MSDDRLRSDPNRGVSPSHSVEEFVARAEARLGTTLRGKYRLERLLGVGAMGSVYEAVHRNGSHSAIKLLHPELSLAPEMRARFIREGYIANRVSHPGVVRVLDDDDDDGSTFLVMELLDGATLESKRHDERLSVEFVLGVVDKVLDVLDAAHAAGVVHRDIKPDNVFLTRGGEVKVLDFGIARLLDASTATRHGIVLGTPDFVAPEQAAGKHDEIDARTDLYSVGAMLFLLLLGQPVVVARSAAEQFAITATTAARRVLDVDAQFDESLARVIDRALSFDKTHRWESAKAMQRALHDAELSSEDTLQASRAEVPSTQPNYDPDEMDRSPESSIVIPLAKPIRRS